MTRLSDARLETLSLLRDGLNITQHTRCKNKASQRHFCMLAFIIFLACAMRAETTDRHQTVKQPKETRTLSQGTRDLFRANLVHAAMYVRVNFG